MGDTRVYPGIVISPVKNNCGEWLVREEMLRYKKTIYLSIFLLTEIDMNNQIG